MDKKYHGNNFTSLTASDGLLYISVFNGHELHISETQLEFYAQICILI